jgi:hypothetical protein
MAMAATMSVEEAHKLTSMHREVIEASIECVCGDCHSRFPPSDIQEWVDWPQHIPDHERSNANGQTAICPHCGVDGVLPDAAGLDLSEEFLARFHEHWFGDPSVAI